MRSSPRASCHLLTGPRGRTLPFDEALEEASVVISEVVSSLPRGGQFIVNAYKKSARFIFHLSAELPYIGFNRMMLDVTCQRRNSCQLLWSWRSRHLRGLSGATSQNIPGSMPQRVRL